ncbi:MAG TPA: heavy metal translocating P-type ATPase, partial [Steroidobacteraceae bacterium]|nr:heavy metal translocating P-type ATPase [Steroidobacteraceae bacterium]
MTQCFHCNELIATNERIYVRIDGRDEPVCCNGCRAVAELITGSGLQDYYRFRDAPAKRAEQNVGDKWIAYDQSELLEQLTHADTDGSRSTVLVLDGIGCAACGWLIDRMLKCEPGICSVSVNAATARMRVQWQPSVIAFSRVVEKIAALGFEPHPISATSPIDRTRSERRVALKRLAVAGLGMMQVMTLAVALYVGGIEENIRVYFRYVSLLCATPVLFYSGWPFLINAWRAIRLRTVTMDVPVSLGLVLAYAASFWNALHDSGDVYFDSVTMFVFFLALSRFVEMNARHRTGDVTDALARLLPLIAHRVRKHDAHRMRQQPVEDVPVSALKVDDEVIVRSGETIPADGRVVEGMSRVDESMLTGESVPVSRGSSDELVAGTMNLQAPLRMRVTAIGRATVLSTIVRLLERAEEKKSSQLNAADRAAAWFLSRILICAGLVAAVWLIVDPSRAFVATLAVLVVSCPCALSLAMPTALAAATTTLARRGVLITNGNALDELAKVTRIAFDKTGTLTHGQPTIERCEPLSELSEADCRRIAFALEQGSEHPLARAFQPTFIGNFVATDIQVVPGSGIEGTVNGKRYRLGRRDYVSQLRNDASLADDTQIFLGDSSCELAAFRLGDRLRNEAKQVVTDLTARGLTCEILSGDSWVAVARTAQACGIERYTARQTPANKLDYVRDLMASGEGVAMVGDGINDAPVLKGANVSIAMGRASALAQVSADIVLIGDSLGALPDAIDIARRTQQVIKQNLVWAIVYNLVALPLAALGLVPP